MAQSRAIGGPAPDGPLEAGVIHVLVRRLVADRAELSMLCVALSSEERARAEAARTEADRDRRVLTRGWLRTTLAGYLGVAADLLSFSTGEFGKPSLSGAPSIHFNLSHADELAVLAVAAEGEVGIDVEAVRAGFSAGRIAERFFAPGEVSQLRSLPVDLQDRAFFECWTRKEAVLKCSGGGLSVPLDSFEVAFGPASACRVLDCGGSRFWLADVSELTPGHVAALAASWSPSAVVYRSPPGE